MRAGAWNTQVLLRELRERNYTGGYTILEDWLRLQRTFARAVAVRRFETLDCRSRKLRPTSESIRYGGAA